MEGGRCIVSSRYGSRHILTQTIQNSCNKKSISTIKGDTNWNPAAMFRLWGGLQGGLRGSSTELDPGLTAFRFGKSCLFRLPTLDSCSALFLVSILRPMWWYKHIFLGPIWKTTAPGGRLCLQYQSLSPLQAWIPLIPWQLFPQMGSSSCLPSMGMWFLFRSSVV